MPTTTGIATEFITFSRTSNATLVDSDGLIKWAPHNLLLASEQFDTASWLKANSGSTTPVVTANAGVAPNGTTTADRVDYGIISATGNISVVYQAFTAVATTYTASVYVKAFAAGDVGKKVWINCYDTAYRGVASVILTTDWQLLSTSVTLTAGSGREVYISTLAPNLGGENQGAVSVLLWGAHLYRSDLGGMKANTSAYPMYNPTTAKNLLGYSEDFSSWSAYNATATASAPAAPNGLTTADTLTGTIDASQHLAYRQYTAFVNATNYKLSVFAKAGTNNFLYLGAQSFGGAIFNLANGVVGSNIGGGSGSIQSIGNGWYRCIVSITATGTSSQIDVGVAPNGTSPTGSATGTIYIWGAQLSDSASLDTYVPNYGAAPTAAAYYGPRLDYDPVTLAAKGLLVEEQRTNTILNSSVFSGWTKATATVLDNQVAGPDGTVTAGVITATAANGEIYTQVTSTSGVAHAGSIYVKRKTGTGSVYLIDAAGGRILVTASISTGSWTRISVTANSVSVNPFFGIRLATSGDELYLWGAQLEAGSFATSYIPVGATTAGATRNADVASVSTQAFPYSATESSIVVAYSIIGNENGAGQGSQYLGSLNAGGNERIDMLAQGSGNGPLFYTIVGGSTVVPLSGASTTVQVNTPWKVGAAIKNADYAASRNGSTPTTVTTAGAMPAAATELGIGAATFGAQLNGHIRQITYLPRRISNTDLVTRTSA